MFGAGYRNKTTGFRCCSDAAIKLPSVASDQIDSTSGDDIVGQKIPSDLTLETADGEGVSNASFQGKLTYLTFFASWCGSCKRELPALRELQEEYEARGFQVVAIGTDRSKERSQTFAEQYDPNYAVAFDPDSRAMGLFKVDAMPASFLIDANGVIKDRMVGFRPEQLPEIKEKIEKLLLL
jgi:peroxiredoxin